MPAIVWTIMSNSLLAMFDEPSLGLSPPATDEIFGVIASLHGSRLSVVLVELITPLSMATRHVTFWKDGYSQHILAQK